MKYGKPYQITIEEGLTLKGTCWPLQDCDANIVIVTGMVEASYRYDEFAHFLNDHGFGVYCIDHYGQGLNITKEEDMGVWPKDGFAKAVEMVKTEVEDVRKLGKPVYLLGHSMGSFVSQEFIQKHSDIIQKAIICGSCGKQFITRIGAIAANLSCLFHHRDHHRATFINSLSFGGYNKKIKNPRTSADWLSYNESNIDEYLADPNCTFIPTGGFYKEFMKGLNRIHRKRNVQRIRKDLPIFLIAGDEDPVGQYGKGVERLYKMYKKYGLQDVRLTIYKGLRHEILNENERFKVYEDILKFYQE